MSARAGRGHLCRRRPRHVFCPAWRSRIGAAAEASAEATANAVLAAVTKSEGRRLSARRDVRRRDRAGASGADRGLGRADMQHGTVRGVPSARFAELRGDRSRWIRGAGRQSRATRPCCSASRLILKLFRRQQPGPIPTCEIGRYLTEHSGFRAIAPFAGSVEYHPQRRRQRRLRGHAGHAAGSGAERRRWLGVDARRTGALFRAGLRCHNAGGALAARERCADGYERASRMRWTREHVGTYLDAAAMLGRRTAEMHLALGQPTDERHSLPSQ